MISRNAFISALCATTLLAGACTPDLDVLENTTPQGRDPFTQALTEDYKTLAQEDKEDASYIQAEQFARKGLGASGGEMVPPIDPFKTNVPPEYLQELSQARAIINGLFAQRMDLKYPNEMAALQVNFDCWVSELVNNNPEAAATCKANCMDDLNQIHAVIESAQPELFIAFFNSGGTSLDPAGHNILKAAAKAFESSQGLKQVLVLGYTDLTGSPAANIRISQERADAGKLALIQLGVPADAILALGQGDSNPLVPTTSANRENRRIEVILR
ncbi:MAG: OmpA family protein [Proteobacteria bacterium]|nr:OmpA family protein [Pseudomonadota bacterium]